MSIEDSALDLPADQIEDRGHALISTRRVEGTVVYSRTGEKLGTVRLVMLNKRSGEAVFAVMSFGDFLGMGEVAHPVPWPMLTYDADRDGYIIDLDREQLEKAPTFRLDEADRPREQSDQDSVYSYYGPLFP